MLCACVGGRDWNWGVTLAAVICVTCHPAPNAQGNPGKWQVTLFNFSLAGTGPGADLDTDLTKHKTTFGETKGVTLEITFPDDFPTSPPNVFVRHPILRDGTGVRRVSRRDVSAAVIRAWNSAAYSGALCSVAAVTVPLHPPSRVAVHRASWLACACCRLCALRVGTSTTAWRR